MGEQGRFSRRAMFGAAGGAAALGALGPVPAVAGARRGRDDDDGGGGPGRGGITLDKIGIQLFTVRDLLADNELDLPGTFEMLADAGYAEVEIGGTYDGRTAAQFRALANQYGLKPEGNHVPSAGATWRTNRAQIFADAAALGIAWIEAGGQSAFEYVREDPSRYPLFHVKDIRWDPAGPRITPATVAQPNRRFWLVDVGKGDIDFARVFSALRDLDDPPVPGGARGASPQTRLAAVGAVRVDVVDRRQRAVLGAVSRCLDRLRPTRQPVEHAGNTGDLEALLPDALDRLHRRAAGGDHVLDDQAALARLERRPLDPALQPVLLSLLAHEERLDLRPRGQRGARDRVGPHRHAPHRGCPRALRLGPDQLAQGREAGRAEDGPLGVDVVLRGAPAREGHLADDEGVLAQLLHERSARVSHMSGSARQGSGSARGCRY